MTSEDTVIGPAERAMRSAGLSPIVQGESGDYEASIRLGQERYFGYSYSRDTAIKDLLEDIPETYRVRIQA